MLYNDLSITIKELKKDSEAPASNSASRSFLSFAAVSNQEDDKKEDKKEEAADLKEYKLLEKHSREPYMGGVSYCPNACETCELKVGKKVMTQRWVPRSDLDRNQGTIQLRPSVMLCAECVLAKAADLEEAKRTVQLVKDRRAGKDSQWWPLDVPVFESFDHWPLTQPIAPKTADEDAADKEREHEEELPKWARALVNGAPRELQSVEAGVHEWIHSVQVKEKAKQDSKTNAVLLSREEIIAAYAGHDPTPRTQP